VLTTLSGAALWVAGLIVLAIVGAATYLASQGILSGSDWLVIGSAILASVGIVTTAHVTGQQVTAALQTPPPVQPPAVPPPEAI
jgi:hypothetical protein